jgi:formyl-CoA transferase/CoA:oxalate CoA-transferase
MAGPLEDIRVLDLFKDSHWPFLLNAPRRSKIEIPKTGDDTRQWGPSFVDRETAYFLSINRNKKIVTLDLSKDKGREIL